MEYRRVGRSGLKVSALSLSGWVTSGAGAHSESFSRVLAVALERGVNLIDLADIYGAGAAEVALGERLKGYPRHQLVLSSKCYWPMSEGVNDRGLSRKHIMESVEGSLRRLQTDYLDLYVCHHYDDECPVEETARAMDDLVRQGKVLYWGTSGWAAGQVREAHRVAAHCRGYAPIVEMPLYNLHERAIEGELMGAVGELGAGLIVWSALAGGALTGKYSAEGRHSEEGRDSAEASRWVEPWVRGEAQVKNQRFVHMARELRVAPSQLALAWALRAPVVSSVLMGVTSEAQLIENLGALDVKLSDEQASRLEAIFQDP
jgi:voltage-dependent potassium channel beta subunit